MSAAVRRRRFKVRVAVIATLLVLFTVSVVSLALAASSFPDVPASHPYFTAITDLASRGVIGGYANGNFGPNDPVTRQQFAKMMVLAGGYPVSESDVCYFEDVAKGDASTLYPDNYVAVCAARGITTGKTPTTFDPYSNITRWQMVTMVVRAADNLEPGLLGPPPAGFAASGSWAQNATHGANASRAEYNGLLTGLDLPSLDPAGNMTRGEVAQVLHNLLGMWGAGSTPTTVGSTTTSAPATTTTTAAPTTTTSSPTTTSTTVFSGSPLEIVSVNYDAPGNDNNNLNEEYVTFRVLVSGSLQGYAVEDAANHRYNFFSRVFSSGAVFKLHTGVGADTQTDLYWGQSGSAIWNNDGDTVKVIDPHGQVVLSHTYEGS
jgi:hypothetical protein